MSLSTRQEALEQKLISQGASVAPLSPSDPKRKAFDDFVESIHTRDLLLILNRCIISEALPEPLQRLFKYILAILPLRSNGIRDVFEFVVAVHPSTQASQNNESHDRKRGPDITADALHAAARLISSPPSFVRPSDWFHGIAPQLLALLDSIEDEELASVAAYMIGKILGPEKYGRPGREGWAALAQPILENIAPPNGLSVDGIIVHSASLSQALKRLETLTNSHPNPGLTTRLLRPIRVPLWEIASWPSPSDQLKEIWLKPAQRLLQTCLKLEHGAQALAGLQKILKNLTFRGQEWNYELQAGGLQIVKSQNLLSLEDSRAIGIDLGKINHAIDFLVAMLSDPGDIRSISDLFLELLRKWLRTSESIPSVHLNSSVDEWESKYIETKLIQEMLDKIPDKLISDSAQILGFVYEFLDDFMKSQGKGDMDDQTIDQATLVLSLLHVVLSSQGFKTRSFQTANSEVLSKIETLLEKMVNFKSAGDEDSAIAEVASNLLQFLIWRDQLENPEFINTFKDKHADDLKQRDLAMSYLTTLEAPPPVRAEGLQLLSSLIESKSIVLDVNTTIHLLCSLLQTEEEYIYLHTIKTIVMLSNYHPKTVLTALLDKYIDTNELLSLDPRLRLGEALAKIIDSQSIHKNFHGPYTHTLGTSLLHVSSLRPTKPVAAATYAKEKRLQAAKDKQAAAAWGGSVPNLQDIIISKQEQDDNEILSQILEGWHGKRNSEDIRIRTSALSIFSTALTSNINAFSPSLISEAVDLSLMILKLETEHSAAILRRAAILLIMSLVRALDMAAQVGEKVGFTFGGNSVEEIREVLGYIEATDTDGLVKRHASDVRESLGNWVAKGLLSLIGTASKDSFDLKDGGLSGGLKGLDINPGNSSVSKKGLRGGKPIIEEIE